MCQMMEDYGDERYEEGRVEGLIAAVRALMENDFSVEKALELLKVPQADRAALRERLV